MAMTHSVTKQKLEATEDATDAESEIDFEEAPFDVVDKIQQLGVNVADIQKLKRAGLATVGTVLKTTRRDLEAIKGMSEAKVEKILEACRKISHFGFMTATELKAKWISRYKITTGSTQLDGILHGGIESSALTEVHGEFRTGKTQLAHTLCVTAQLPRDMHGGNGKVIFVDTEGTFRPDRIVPIAERFGLEPERVLDNILYARVHTHDQQMEVMPLVAAKIAEDTVAYSLLIVDSVMGLFRSDFSGRGELSERQQRLGKHLSHITKIAEEYNVAVLLVNQVCADPGANTVFVKDPKKPIGGHILGHAATHRLALRKGAGDQRICKIIDSPDLPEMEATFSITNGGLADPE